MKIRRGGGAYDASAAAIAVATRRSAMLDLEYGDNAAVYLVARVRFNPAGRVRAG